MDAEGIVVRAQVMGERNTGCRGESITDRAMTWPGILWKGREDIDSSDDIWRIPAYKRPSS